MKRLMLVAALAVGSSLAAAAQPAATTKTATAPFGCEGRGDDVCHFRIFYLRGGRDVVLPAGMKTSIPEVRIGQDSYCVAVNKKPVHKCPRKVINANYNS